MGLLSVVGILGVEPISVTSGSVVDLPYRMHRASSAQVLPIFTDQQLYEHKIK